MKYIFSAKLLANLAVAHGGQYHPNSNKPQLTHTIFLQQPPDVALNVT